MILPIVQAGDPVLRRKARLLSREELLGTAIQDLILSMRETMYAAPGVGLAAPQVGESLQLVVLEDRAESMVDVSSQALEELGRRPVPFQVLVNPIVTSCDPHMAAFFEGCLSVSGYRCVVPRHLEVSVTAWNEAGDPVAIHARGWFARILQHEIDHLAGTLCVDRMYPRSLCTTDNYMQRWKGVPVPEVQAALGADGRWD